MKIDQTKPVTITDLWSGIQSDVSGASRLEVAAQALAGAIHQQFQESVVLARVFVTVDFDALPASNQAFVRELTKSSAPTSRATSRCCPSLAFPARSPIGRIAASPKAMSAYR